MMRRLRLTLVPALLAATMLPSYAMALGILPGTDFYFKGWNQWAPDGAYTSNSGEGFCHSDVCQQGPLVDGERLDWFHVNGFADGRKATVLATTYYLPANSAGEVTLWVDNAINPSYDDAAGTHDPEVRLCGEYSDGLKRCTGYVVLDEKDDWRKLSLSLDVQHAKLVDIKVEMEMQGHGEYGDDLAITSPQLRLLPADDPAVVDIPAAYPPAKVVVNHGGGSLMLQFLIALAVCWLWNNAVVREKVGSLLKQFAGDVKEFFIEIWRGK